MLFALSHEVHVLALGLADEEVHEKEVPLLDRMSGG